MGSPYEQVTGTWPWWRDNAACVGMDVERFYPPAQLPPQRTRAALDVCERCAVRTQCLADALLRGERHGVWGGVVEADRVVLSARRPSSWRDALTLADDAIRAGPRASASVGQGAVGSMPVTAVTGRHGVLRP